MNSVPLLFALRVLKQDLCERFRYFLRQWKTRSELRYSGVWAYLSPYAIISAPDVSRLKIGRNVYISEYALLDVTFDPSRDLKDRQLSRLEIGEDTYIGPFNNIRAGGGGIIIGKHCMISQLVTIVASNHSLHLGHPMKHQPWQTEKTGVILGDDVWVGAGACILPGVRVGSGAVIASNSVVTQDVPENAIFGGNPAKLIRYRAQK